MKNKLLVSAFAMTLAAILMTSCRENTDFDAICDDLTEQSVSGLFSGAVPDLDDLIINVAQYQFNEDGTAARMVMSVGDGVYVAPDTVNFSSWKLAEYGANGISRKIIMTPANGEAPIEVFFTLNGILSENHPFAGDKSDKIKDMVPTQDAVTGKKWYGNDTTYYKIDTVINVTKYDTTYTYKPKKDPETGQIVRDSAGHIIYEQVIKDITERIVPTKMKWPIAPKTINIRSLELDRDASSLVNTGKWYMLVKEYDMDTKTREITCRVDTTSSYDFHWAFANFASSASFIIRARHDGDTQEYFDIKYDHKIPAITLDKQVLKVQE